MRARVFPKWSLLPLFIALACSPRFDLHLRICALHDVEHIVAAVRTNLRNDLRPLPFSQKSRVARKNRTTCHTSGLLTRCPIYLHLRF